MIVLAGLVIGVTWGIISAKRRNGNRLDMAQYAAGYGIAFMLIGVFLTIILERVAA